MSVDIQVEQGPAQHLPGAHQSLGRGSGECRDVSVCHWHSFVPVSPEQTEELLAQEMDTWIYKVESSLQDWVTSVTPVPRF